MTRGEMKLRLFSMGEKRVEWREAKKGKRLALLGKRRGKIQLKLSKRAQANIIILKNMI